MAAFTSMSCAHQSPVDFPLSCRASPRQSWRVEASALACKGVDRCVACAAVSVSGTGAVVSVLSTESAFASKFQGGGGGDRASDREWKRTSDPG